MTLPKGWVAATIGETSRAIQYGLTCTSSAHGDGYRYIRITDIQDRRIDWAAVPFADVPSDKAAPYQVEIGDLLFARTGATVGKSFLIHDIKVPATFASYLIRVRCDDELILPEFAAWYFQSPSYWVQILDGAEGTGQPNFNGSKLATLTLDLPPPAEQRRIVAKLDALTARLARARAELDRVPVLAANLRQQVLTKIFTPASERRRLGDMVEFVTSGSRGWAQFYADEGPAFIRVGNVNRLNVELSFVDVQRVQPPGSAEGARTATRSGDLVVTITADIGRVGVVPASLGPAFVNQHVALARLVDQTDAYWIAWHLSSVDGQMQLLAKNRGITKAGLGLQDIRQVLVPMPPKSERDAIVSAIGAAFARADRLEAEAARARALIDRLEAAILAKAFRGELVPQDPGDEPASVLLERIRAQRAAAAKPKRGRHVGSASA